MQKRQCRLCTRDIFFATTDKGKQVPLDARVVTAALYEVEEHDDGSLEARRAFSSEDAGQFQSVYYVSHFLTCPEAAKFTKGKAQGGAHGQAQSE